MGIEIEGEIDVDEIEGTIEELAVRVVEEFENSDPVCECGDDTFHVDVEQKSPSSVVPIATCESCGRTEVIDIQ